MSHETKQSDTHDGPPMDLTKALEQMGGSEMLLNKMLNRFLQEQAQAVERSLKRMIKVITRPLIDLLIYLES